MEVLFMSFARLQEHIDKLQNPTVVGLDPALSHIPDEMLEKYYKEYGETLEAASLAVTEFNIGLIDALCDIVPAVKPQSAYYEALGPFGAFSLQKTCEYAKKKGMYVILDGKRNDIGSTAAAYSAAYLGVTIVKSKEYLPYEADALTVNAYLGSDGIKPFIENAVKYDKAIFALVKTSNPSAGELQDRLMGYGDGPSFPVASQARLNRTDEPSPCPEPSPCLVSLYCAVGDLMEEIAKDTIDKHGYTCVGAVVGATYPEEAEFLRKRLKNTFFLVPGYGAQGGSAADAAKSFDSNKKGAIVNSSRAIIAAWKKGGSDYKTAAREEVLKMREELRKVLKY